MSNTIIEEQREKLHEILTSIDGVKKVYYQPTYTTKLEYPCIMYSLNRLNTHYASDGRYLSFPSYTLTLIDYDPESIIQKSILDLNGSCRVSFDRFYTADNLNHWAYALVFTELLW